jgi:hypothetical protein
MGMQLAYAGAVGESNYAPLVDAALVHPRKIGDFEPEEVPEQRRHAPHTGEVGSHDL